MGSRTLPPDPRRILLVRLSSIGDVVCAMPLAMALRRRFPRARLWWAVEPDAAPLLEHHASRAEPVLFPRTGGPLVRARAVRALREVGPDLVVDPQGNAKSGAVARLAARGAAILGLAREDVRERANLAFSTVKAPPSGARHSVRRGLGLLRVYGGDPETEPVAYGLVATAAEEEAAERRLRDAGLDLDRPVAVIHAGRLSDLREWTAEGYEAAGRVLRARGWQVAIEGPDAAGAAPGLVALADADLAHPGLDLRGLAVALRVLARGGAPRVLVSADTSVPHLAAAAGLPVVLLAGPQDPDRTGPLGTRTTVVRAWEGLPCAPCRKRRCHYEEDRACMRRIAPAQVVAAVEAVGAR